MAVPTSPGSYVGEPASQGMENWVWDGNKWVDTGAWMLRSNDPLTSTSDVTTGSGTWTIASGQLQCSPVAFTDCRMIMGAGGQNTLMAGYAHIAEVEWEVPASWVTGSLSRGVSIGFHTGISGAFIAAKIRASSEIGIEENGGSGTWTAYTIPTAGTWVKLRMLWNGYERWTVWANGTKMIDATLKTPPTAFSTSMKATLALISESSGGSSVSRFRNLKSWSLVSGVPPM